jgi:hypothetical protein
VLTLAQTATTSLRGTIKDSSGALVTKTTINLTDNTTGKIYSTTTDSGGSYIFPQIFPSRYSIEASASGFGDQTKSAELLVNQPATIDFVLTVRSNTVTVDVSASAQTLNTSDASLGSAVDSAEIQALPSETRNVPDLLSLQPGVLYLPPIVTDSRSGAVNGGRSDQGNVTLDGIDDNVQVTGYAFTGVLRETQDSLGSFRVITGNANADSGRSSGAQISLITKSGSNRLHGALYEYNRPTFTVANDWFNKQAELNSGAPNVPGKFIRNIYGGAVGGPIKRDKLFFFGNYEASRIAEDVQVTRVVPTAGAQAGNLVYLDANGNTQSLTSSQVSALDASCQICRTSAYPNAPGPNPNSLAYFKAMPAANGQTLGDGGYNSGSYSFSSPNPMSLNTSIARLDYVPSDRHRLFVRGNLQKDTGSPLPGLDSREQFPGQGPSNLTEDNSKGITAGETWAISSKMTNDLRYGYVRQGVSSHGAGKGDYVDFTYYDQPTAETRTTFTDVPVNNIVDNLSWTKGKHTLQFGGNWRLIHQNYSTNSNSFDGASTNPFGLGDAPPQPSSIGAPALNLGFTNSYSIAYASLVGTVPQITDVFNYRITSVTSATALPDGAFIARNFKANEFEWYLQDAWRVRPNLTVTFGVRHTILQTPYESNGQMVAPTIDTHAWYLQRENAALAGQIDEPDLEFAPAGPHYGRSGFYAKAKDNFAPRIAVAYSPDGKTSFRAGAGIYYDHYGEALISNFEQQGSFGMSSKVSNPLGVYSFEGNVSQPPAPRFLGRQSLPPISVGSAPTTETYPYVAPLGNFAVAWGLDNKMRTPYSEMLDFSVQRELPGGFTLDAAYAGRLGRHLLQQLDLTAPVDYVDPAGGGDYYSAARQLSVVTDANSDAYGGGTTGRPLVVVPSIPYFEHVFPFMADLDAPGESATEAIYNHEWAPNREGYGETSSIADIDHYCFYGCPAGWRSHFWQDQFSSLYVLSSSGMSYYNAAQLVLRHPASHGLTLDFSYALSKSIDYGSDTERSTEKGSGAANTFGYSEIINPWKPSLNRSVSDFDTRHLVAVEGVYQLPFGRGKAFAGSSTVLTNAIVGGWQLSGINRWSSGLPFSFREPGWTTDWEWGSYGVLTQPVKVHRHFDANGNPQYFDNSKGINSGVFNGAPIRIAYPGEAGQRNAFRGDGYFDLDTGLSKSWRVQDHGALKFGWEIYNVTNTARFDPASIGGQLTGGNLGISSRMLTQPRRMQFSLRFDF